MAKPVRWDLIADPSRFNRGFREAERTSGRFQQHMRRTERATVRFSSSVGSLGPIAVRAFGGAAVAVGGLAAAGAVLGVKTAANLETAEVGFTRLLGSAKRARSFLGDLKSFAARTPFELPGLVDAARGLVGAGTAAKNVIPILTALGDASGALGLDQERFGRVMTAVTQIMNKGKVQSEELLQITEAGIPIWQLLAKATGKPVPELQKLMQQGKLLSKDVLPALFSQMRKDYGGGMAQQAKTLNGIWSTFKDTVSLTLADALQPLVPVMKTALPQAGTFFQRSVEGITKFFRTDLGPELGRVRQAWDDNRTSILGMATGLQDSQRSMLSTKDAASGLADVLVTITTAGGQLSRFLEQADGHFRDFQGSLQTSVNRLADLFGLRPPPEVTAWLLKLDGGLEDAAAATGRAATAADRHATALRGEKSALEALQGALDDEKASEIDLRQAKLNVSTAQSRLNTLKREGKQGSFEYKQAQLDLERAQIDLTHKTDDYRNAQRTASAATAGAMHASQAAAGAHRELKRDADRAGYAAWLMGGKIKDGLLRIPKGRTIIVRARAAVDISASTRMYLKAAQVPGFHARGTLLPGYGGGDILPAMLEPGEAVVPKDKARRPEFRSWARNMGIPGFIRGGIAGGVGLRFSADTSSIGDLRRWHDAVVTATGRIGQRLADSLARSVGKGLSRAIEKGLGGGSTAIKAFIRSTDPLPYRWGAAGPGAYDCSGLVSAVLGKMTGRGGGHGQRYFTTSSIRSGILGIKPGLGGVLQIGVTAGTGHMAGRYGGLGFEAESTRTGIKIGSAASRPESFARHFHLAKGGRVDEDMLARFAALTGADIGGDFGRLRINGKVFDSGGFLPPHSATLAVNRTSRAEPIGFDYDRLAAAVGPAVAAAVAQVLHGTSVQLDGQAVGALVVEPQFRDLRRLLRSSGRPSR